MPWRDDHRDAFVALCADADVMADLGGPIGRVAALEKLAGYVASYEQHGVTKWAVEDLSGTLLGYTGAMPEGPDHPLGDHFEIGWRFLPCSWGKGYASEAARAALTYFFAHNPAVEVLAYTTKENVRSQGVMERLNLTRTPERDFTAPYDGQPWHGLVWVTGRETWGRELAL
ncbi:MAG: GNAT family N-acetyltransferase [Hyphomicrobiaceae bacterium]